jgi:WD40 repeat protein
MSNTSNNIPPGFTLRHTLRGHSEEINRIAWSPDGRFLASSSFDKTARIWDAQTGEISRTLINHGRAVYSVVWSPDGKYLASSSQDGQIAIWGVLADWRFHPHPLTSEYAGIVYDFAWFSNVYIASCSQDQTIRIWNVDFRIHTASPSDTLRGHSSEIFCIAYSPDSHILASGSATGPIRLWVVSPPHLGGYQQTLRGHSAAIYDLTWSPDSKYLASCSEDRTIRIWERGGKQLHILNGHTDSITSISFSYDSRLLASKSRDGTICIWHTNTWEPISILAEAASNGVFAGIAFHPNEPVLATLGANDKVLRIWELDIPALLGLAPIKPVRHYVNAKVVLVGESGVGKSALGLVLTEQPFVATESTHGRFVREFDHTVEKIDNTREEQRETFLWDLAGQPGYRLIHQLYLSEVAVALIVFSNLGRDPLDAVSHWIRAIRTAQSVQGNETMPIKKFLVEARTDLGRAKVSPEDIQDFVQRQGLDNYFITSAKEGSGIAELEQAIKQAIDWDMLPKVTSTELFQRIQAFLVAQKASGSFLATSDYLYRTFLHSEGAADTPNQQAQFDTCIGRVASQGLIRRLSFGGLILLQPELLDFYASALVNEARNDPDGLGCISETKARNGNFLIPSNERMQDKEQEKLLLLAMINDLLRYEIALHEQGIDEAFLVFPSEVTRRHSDLPDPQGKTVVYTFEGPVLNIYATLAVRLSHSGVFEKKDLWKDAITYSASVGGICGVSVRELEEGYGEFTLFFDDAASEETRFQFEEYVRIHLERRALPESIKRERIFFCPQCKRPLDGEIVKLRRANGQLNMLCALCEIRVPLLDREERLGNIHSPLASEASRSVRLAEMDQAANREVKLLADRLTIQGKEATEDFDVFLCHHGIDKPAVKEIGEQLKKQGILPWLDEWQLPPGQPWQRLLEQQIGKIKSAAVFVGQSGIGPWQQFELDAFLREFANRGCPVIPVILMDAPRQPQLPIFLQGMTWVDFRKHEPDPMSQLIWGITKKKVTPL